MKKTCLITVALLLCAFTTWSRPKPEVIRVVYRQLVNGNPMTENGNPVLVAGTQVSVSSRNYAGLKLINTVPEEKEYIAYSGRKTFQTANYSNGESFYVESGFDGYPELTYTGEKATIAGFACEKAVTTLRSNHIEIWFTREIPFRGTPSASYGIPDGLVLKIVRNNNFEIVADTVSYPKNVKPPVIPAGLGEKTDPAMYRYRITQHYITTVNVFREEQISWGNTVENPAGEVPDVTYRYAGGTVILKKVKLPQVPDDCQLFAEVTQYSNGDAYDRTGTVFMIPQGRRLSFLDALQKGIDKIPFFTSGRGKHYQGMTATPDYLPVVEILRFFTPFGIRQYNEKSQVLGQTWENAAWYKQEITELMPLLKGEAWIGVFIGNYDKGGHKVSLDLKYYPGSQFVTETPSRGKWFLPLFNTLNIMEMAGQNYGDFFDTDSLTVHVEIPEGVKNLKLRYITTGHGGWDNGDEFNPKINTVIIDGKAVHSFIPWRTDCGIYRRYNPSSGNFWNGMTSSDYSRSGWCPGAVTNPVYFTLDGIKPGKHTLKITIPQGKPEGNSFSAWNISGLLSGETEN